KHATDPSCLSRHSSASLLFFSIACRTPRTILFPYTTLFRSLAELETQAREKWPLVHVSIVHRLGHLELGEASIAIAVSSPHRQRSEEHTSELQSRRDLVCRLLLAKKKTTIMRRGSALTRRST